MSRIFISHSSRDNFAARAFADWLTEAGWGPKDVFLDIDPESGIRPGERWERALHEAAHRCEAVVFLISASWLQSEWCGKEFALAKGLNKRLFGVVIDDIGIGGVPDAYRGAWQLVDLNEGADGRLFRAVLKDGSEGHVRFSRGRLVELREGLRLAGLDPEYFDWPPDNEPYRAPYRGLEPLEAADAGIFFGREAPTVDALDRLRGLREAAPPRLLAILGASGAGKSSFLRAGLLPRLARDDRNFHVLPVVRPQGAPLTGESGLGECLASACAGVSRATIRAEIEAGGVALAARLAAVAEAAGGATLILPIDQAEELFGGEAGPEAAAFLAVMRLLAEDTATPLVVLLTIRSDCYDQFQRAPSLDGLHHETLPLGPMPRGAYRTIIEAPAARYAAAGHKLALDPRLTEALLSEIEAGQSPDALPLLAFTLDQLFVDYHGDGSLTLEDYRVFGGIEGAIGAAVTRALAAARGDRANAAPLPEQLALLKRGLIPWLAGIDPTANAPRRKTAKWDDIPEEARPLMETLVEARLLRTDKDAAGARTVEPAHEALLRQWAVLAGWLNDDLSALATLDGVKDAARIWAANDRDGGFLTHSGARLAAAEGLNARMDLLANLTGDERQYLAACTTAERERAEREKRQARKLFYVTLVGAVMALVLAIVAGGLAWWGSDRAGEAKSNERFALAALADNTSVAERRADDAAKLAIAAWPRRGDESGPMVERAFERLSEVLPNLHSRRELHGHTDIVESAAFSPDGKRVVTASRDGTSRIWDTETAKELRRFPGSSGASSAAFSSDGRRVLTSGNSIQVWDAIEGTELLQISGDSTWAAFSPEGWRIVAASTTTAQVWDARTGKELVPLVGHRGGVTSGMFSSDGTRIVTGSYDHTVRVWDATTGRELRQFVGGSSIVNSVAFSPDGRKVASAAFDTVSIWDCEGGIELLRISGHQSSVNSVRFSPDGRSILTASSDRTIRAWDTLTGKELFKLTGSQHGVESAEFSPDGRQIVEASGGRVVRIWHVTSSRETMRLTGHESYVYSAVFSPDNKLVATTSDEIARIWDATTGEEKLRLGGHPDIVRSASFSPDGERLATISGKFVTVWDLATGQALTTVAEPETINSIAFSADGLKLVISSGKTARILRAGNGEELLRLSGHNKDLVTATFSSDGARVLTASYDTTVRTWDAVTGRELLSISGSAYGFDSAEFSHDGRRIVTATRFEPVRIWDAASGTKLLELVNGHELASRRGPGRHVAHATFSPDGLRIASGANDGTLTIWDSQTGGALLQVKLREPNLDYDGWRLWSVAFSPDGTRIVAASQGGLAYIWDISTLEQGDAFEVACRLFGDSTALGDVEVRYGLSGLLPICGDYPPLPVDAAKLE